MKEFANASDWEKFNSSLLIEVTRPNGVFTCTGIAVSDQTIITAAHCLDGKIKKVRVFTQETYNPNNSSLEVSDYQIHPQYNPKQSHYVADIARIRMKEKLPPYIKLFPIYTGDQMEGNLYRFGFGARNKKNIRTVATPTFKRLNRENLIMELNDFFSRSGDSGGPIYLQQGPNTYILAIHSTFSHGPEGNFSFNPLLSPYLSWIYAH